MLRARAAGRAAAAAALAMLCAANGCAHAPARVVAKHPAETRAPAGPVADTVTAALWHLDETGGTRIADAGPFGLDGRAGIDTRTDFGRFHGARVFVRSIDSFLLVPYNPMLESPRGLTVEAWIYVNEYGPYEDTPIAARWTQQANEQSWMFSVLGRHTPAALAALPSPGYHEGLVQHGERGELMFVFQPEQASPPRAFFSSVPIELQKWTHVAVAFDGDVVRFYLNGLLDSQYATRGAIRSTHAALLAGNYFDPRWLSDFGGDLRVASGFDLNPYYAFDGLIDELRISSVARREFESTGRR